MVWSGRSAAALATTLVLCAAAAHASTGAPIIGEIERIRLDSPTDRYSGGVMVVGGQNVILPRNLLIDLPANRLTLQELFTQAPPGCDGSTGLARADACLLGAPGAQATILANRTSAGEVIAGDVFIAKGLEAVTGTVTFIDHAQGYFRINGVPGSDGTGLLVRINDPEGRHTVQTGVGCRAGAPNCSPDARFGVDPDNYTAAFVTGYPLCLPSTQVGGARTVGASPDGRGDPLCPDTNRAANPVPDSTRLAPVRLGDNLLVEGNYEVVGGVRFLSAWHVQVHVALTTRSDAQSPDFIALDETGWDVPGFDNQRARFLLIGFTTLPDSQVDVWGLHSDPSTNEAVELPLASTVGNPDTINLGIAPTAASIFKINYDVDFIAGADPRRSPCTNLRNAGFPACSVLPTLAEEFAVLSPVGRELVVRTRRTVPLAPGVGVRDVQGNPAPHSQYLTPVTLVHPEFVEINLGALQTPFAFSGIPWNMDRRLGPGGCGDTCESTPQPLDPFPWEESDPRRPASLIPLPDLMLSFVPFGPDDNMFANGTWPPAPPAPRGIFATPGLPLVCSVETPPAPALTRVTPALALQGGSGSATVSGAQFVPGATCSFGEGVSVACSFVSATELSAVFSVSPTAAPGPRVVSVTTPGGSTQLLDGFSVVASSSTPQSPPTLVSSTPGSVTVGTSATLTVLGSGLQPGVTCSAGEGLTVRSCVPDAAGTSLSLSLTVAATAVPGPRLLTVRNLDGQSASLGNALQVVAAEPPAPAPLALTSVSSMVGNAGTSLQVSLFGTGFQQGCRCDFGPGILVRTCDATSASLVSATLEIGTSAAGTRDVRITNPDGKASTLADAFTVEPLGPSTTALFLSAFDTDSAWGLGEGWAADTNWRVTGGTATAGPSSRCVGRCRAFAELTPPTAYSITARMRVDDAGKGALMVRASEKDWYELRVRRGALELNRYLGGKETELKKVKANVRPGEWHTYRLTISGTTVVRLEASMDDVPALDVEDASSKRLQSGQTGLVEHHGEVHFDDVEVRTP